MAKSMATLDSDTTCSSWNYSGHRLAAGSVDGSLALYDASDASASPSSSFTCSSKVRVGETSIVKIVWLPPEFGDAVACICEDGCLSIWEEAAEDSHALEWKLCKNFKNKTGRVLDVQFGVSRKSLKMVAAYSDGYIRIFELLDPLELKNWQLQAEFQNVIDSVSSLGKASGLSASVSWNALKGENQEPSFVLGFNSDSPHVNSSKVWEFDETHNRWLAVAELALPEDRGDRVFAVAWAPNIGRSYEVVAVATSKGIGIWHVGLTPDMDGRLSVKKAASLSGHEGEVREMEWDMSGMTLASSGSDGMVRLWQSNLNGKWHQQATLQPFSSN
ncbi:PREDICTED: protein SEH1 [Tarenaya hassleriana]|uniref:protein SEH1 n=1 Tax=Tarenaya hassleriana TaxID=28532 RepID=UPI00053C9ED3|nr:PREDICTED: protein SEH1 [Tarenaya hassleriana]